MLLADTLPNTPWEVVGSDISTQVLAKAEAGHYPWAATRAFRRTTCANTA
jgi:chemotaxis protein methyltransferase CheR